MFKPDKSCIYPLTINSVDLMKSSMKRSRIGFKHENFKNLPKSSNGHNIQKNQKNEKPKHIAFLCHIVRIQVDKQGLDIFKLDKSCIYP